MRTYIIPTVLAAALLTFVPVISAQNLVTNGGLSHPSYPLPPNPPNSFNADLPSGWGNTNITTPDLFWSGTSFSNGGSATTAFTDSSDGGTFVNALAYSGAGEGFEQTINGLTVGQSYELTFEQSNSRRYDAVQVWWQVTFGGETLTSDPMTTPDAGVAYPWENQSMLFTATSMSQILSFTARSSTTQDTSTVIDGISLKAIPESSSALLAGLTAGLLLLPRRRRN